MTKNPTKAEIKKAIQEAAEELAKWADPHDSFASEAPYTYPRFYVGYISEKVEEYFEVLAAEGEGELSCSEQS